MKGFYEKFREETVDIHVNRNGRYIYPTHFHKNMEILVSRRGRYEISINDKTYEVGDGQVAVIDSYDVHGYSKNNALEDQDSCIVIIPYEELSSFNAARKNLRILEPLIADKELCDEILSIVDGFLLGERSNRVRKASAKLILSLLLERLEFTEDRGRGEVTLVREMLAYVQENFKGDVSRTTIARELGYTEAHVSRVFHRYMKIGLSEYVNGLRLAYVEKMKEEGTELTTLELIYEAGFKSQQTYYRCKKQSQEAGKR